MENKKLKATAGTWPHGSRPRLYFLPLQCIALASVIKITTIDNGNAIQLQKRPKIAPWTDPGQKYANHYNTCINGVK